MPGSDRTADLVKPKVIIDILQKEVAAIEEAFDLMMDAEDILEMTSYENVKQLLTSKYEIAF